MPYSRRRTRAFKLIALLLPLLLLVLAEGMLRLFHYGHDGSLFIEAPGNKDYYVMNPHASKKFFGDQANATTGNRELFRKEKEAGTLRIFVLGESTTIGYPYFHNGSFHRMLQYRLTHLYPDKQFEIVNVALTAVNSYTVLGFAKQVVNYQPDAVLIYTGHNEYYGAMGVGATDRVGSNTVFVQAVLAARQLRVIQALTSLYHSIAGSFSKKTSNAGRTRMEMMAAEQLIPYGSSLFYRGIDQFRVNMDATLRVLDKHRVPVFLSSLVSNERDLPPFVSEPVDSVRYPAWSKYYEAGRRAVGSFSWNKADSLFRLADRIWSGHAMCNYYLGRVAMHTGNDTAMAFRFSRAKELDALRFRAPDSINTIIRQLCGKYPNTHLVDSWSAFIKISPYIGTDLLLEHVHPNLNGYAILSDAFYRSMSATGLFPDKAVAGDRLNQSVPILELDALTGSDKIEKLKGSWPFKNNEFHEPPPVCNGLIRPTGYVGSSDSALHPLTARLAKDIAYGRTRWQDAIDTLYNEYISRKNWPDAARVMENLVLEFPFDASYSDKAANLFGEAGDWNSALFYFRRSFLLEPGFDKARSIFVLCFKLDQPALAMPYLDYAIRNNTSSFNLQPVRQLAVKVIQLEDALRADSSGTSLMTAIANTYLQMGNKDGALIYTDKVIRLDPHNRDAQEIREKLGKAAK